MRSGSILGYILLILLLLVLFGAISVGDIMSVFFYICVGVAVLALIGFIALRVKINKLRRNMENPGSGGHYKTYTWKDSGRTNGSRTGNESFNNKDNVTVEQKIPPKSKIVNDNVGDYAEFEEVTEETN